jgi:hypothetical protein
MAEIFRPTWQPGGRFLFLGIRSCPGKISPVEKPLFGVSLARPQIKNYSGETDNNYATILRAN